jgi:hypothetical protein
VVSIRLSRRIPTWCSICRQRVSALIDVEESADVPEPRQSWRLCPTCNDAVSSQLARSPISGPLRLRIAVGVVASERNPRYRSRGADDDRRSDQRIERLIIFTIVASYLLHGLMFIAVALAISRAH